MRGAWWAACICGVCLTALLFGCKPEKPDAQKFRIGEQGLAEAAAAESQADEVLRSTVVATVGGVELDGLEVRQALQEVPTPERYYYSNPEKVALFTQNYALILLYAWMGQRSGMGEDGYVRFLWEDALAEAYRDAYLEGKVDPAQFGQQEVTSWLAEHEEEAKVALGSQAQEKEHLEQYARRRLADKKELEIWQAHLGTLSRELGFEMPAVVQAGTPEGQATTKAAN